MRAASNSNVEGRSLAHLYLITVGTALYAWPNVLFLSENTDRLLWLAASAALLTASAKVVERRLASSVFSLPPPRAIPWFAMAVMGASVATTALTTPLLLSSGESLFLLLPLAAARSILSVSPRPVVLTLVAAVATGVIWGIMTRRSRTLAWGILAATIAGTIAIAITVDRTVISRYPPLVHLLQTGTALLSMDAWAFRLPTVIWAILTPAALWTIPNLSTLNRWLITLALFTTPLGWFYHVTLYQAPGQIVFALLILHAAARLCQGGEDRRTAALLGVLCTLWFLYRETALAPIAAVLGVLALFHRWRSVGSVLLILSPIVAAWLLLFLPTSDYIASLYTAPMLLERQRDLSTIALSTLRTIPNHFHPLGLAVMLSCTLWVSLKGSRQQRILLGLAWVIALANLLGHMMVAIPSAAGYGRFNALMTIPLAIAVGLTPTVPTLVSKRFRASVGVVLLTLLVAVTPWDIVRYANSLPHSPHTTEERWTTGGFLYTALPRLVEEHLDRIDTMVILSTDTAFIDIFIAQGMMTVEQRTALLERSRHWEPGDPASPLLVVDIDEGQHSYLTEELRTRLRRTAAWARNQPDVLTVTVGGVSTLVVSPSRPTPRG